MKRKIVKKLLLAAPLSSALVGAHAQTTSPIRQTTTPTSVLVFPNGGKSGGEYFTASGLDFLATRLVQRKDWRVL